MNSSNCCAAWPTNMSRPLACVHPHSLASRSKRVSRGLYTASNTTLKPAAWRASFGTGVISTLSGYIPRDVVFARTSPFTAPLRISSSVTASPPHANASAWARSKLRLAMMILPAPLNAAPNAKPRAAPPAPTTIIVFPRSTVSVSHVFPLRCAAYARSIVVMAAL